MLIFVGKDYAGAPRDGWMMEHRYVVQQQLGRTLDRHEHVHHKNGIRSDNRPENLELWTVGHKDPAGVRISDKLIDTLLDQPEIAALPDNVRESIATAIKRVVR